MAKALSDNDIHRLILSDKTIHSSSYFDLQNSMKAKGPHKEYEVVAKSTKGEDFLIKVRQSTLNPLDFSAILCYIIPHSNTLFRLKRYNGKSHEHRNKIEGTIFYDFHTHTATERYQEQGFYEDAYAEPTGNYSNLNGAIDTMMKECQITIKGPVQQRII